MRKALIAFCLIVLSTNAIGQTDKINQKDKAGKKQGHWIFYGTDRPESGYADSAKVEEGNYVDGRKEGHWIKYAEDGSIRAEGNYANNRPSSPPFTKYWPNGKVKETSECNWGTNDTQESNKDSTIKEFIPPKVINSGDHYNYIAPKYNLIGYFPLIYIGKPCEVILADYYPLLYPDSTTITDLTSHTVSRKSKGNNSLPSSLSIILVPENRFWVGQPTMFGEDTMEYHSASTVVLRNLSNDTLTVGEDFVLDLKLQYFDGKNWFDAPENPSYTFLLPEMDGFITFYPGEIIVTAMPLFENEKRKLRIVYGETISEEFYITNN